jgi:hypothetical protein
LATQELLKLGHAERYELFADLVWKMPELGLAHCVRMYPTDRVPALFAAAPRGQAARPLPWRQVAAEGAASVSLLEWTMRDAIALGRQADIEKQIAELEAKKSDDAKLARVVYELAQDKPVDLSRIAKVASNGTKSFVPVMGGAPLGSRGQVVPLDAEIVRQALTQEEYKVAGVKHLYNLLVIAGTSRHDVLISVARHMKHALREKEPAATHEDLAHWVTADDVQQSDLIAGHPAESLWIKRDAKTWGHQFGAGFSTLMLRYPLAGDYSISFRARDSAYAEGAAMLAGRTIEFFGAQGRMQLGTVGMRGVAELTTDALKPNRFNAIRLVRKQDSLTIHVGDEFQKELAVPASDFPFFGMSAQFSRETSFDSVKIEGDVTIPRSIELLSPSLAGWTARFKNGRLPDVVLLPENAPPARAEDEKPQHDWRLVDGVLESVDRAAGGGKSPSDASKRAAKTPPRREGLIRYLRPLGDGEQVSLEFYYEPGKYSLTPALGRIAILPGDKEVALHWITADAAGITTGVDDQNRVVDPQAEQPTPIALKNNDWNQLTLALEGDVATLSINGQAVYRRTWEHEAGRQFGLFHDPTQYQVRVRNVKLGGDWPEKLPADLLELKNKEQKTSGK